MRKRKRRRCEQCSKRRLVRLFHWVLNNHKQWLCEECYQKALKVLTQWALAAREEIQRVSAIYARIFQRRPQEAQ